MPVLSYREIAERILKLPPDQQARAVQAFKLAYEGKIPSPQIQANSHLYASDPVLWAQDKLNEYIWSAQRKMMYAVRDHRRNAFYSCHRIGKSYCLGRIAFWWLDTHIPGEALVVTSAHSATQVKLALWREMARVHSKGKFPGRMNQTEYYMPMPSGKEEIVAFGRKPKDDDTTAFQGTYAKYVLVLGDEACYIPDTLWNGMDTLVSNEHSRIVMFGNPDDSTTQFAKVCKPGSGWNVLGFGYLHTPNFVNHPQYAGTDEDREIDSQCPQEVLDSLIGPQWVSDKLRDWGESSPMFISKVLGQFPLHNTDGLIPMQWIRAAMDRTLSPHVPVELGVDVGGGGNASTIARRQGPIVRIVHKDHNPDTMATLSSVLDRLHIDNASSAKVDYIGIGHGAVDRAREMSKDQSVKKESPDLARRAGLIHGIEVGRTAQDKEQYVNLRAEGYWALRERFREGNIDLDPNDESLAAQLCAIRYKRSGGRIQIESKEDMRRRGVSSPDDADAVMLSFLDVPVEEKKTPLWSWG